MKKKSKGLNFFMGRLFYEQQRGHDADAQNDRQELDDGFLQVLAVLKLGDQVGPGDIDETSGGYRQEVDGEILYQGAQEQGRGRAGEGGQGGEKVIQEGAAGRESPVDQHAEITDLLRDFVKDHRERGGEPEGDVDRIARRDDHAVDEIMDAVADQVHGDNRMGMMFGGRDMAVSPADELLDDEKYEQADDNKEGSGEPGADVFKGFGQKMDEGVAEQAADRETDQDEEDPAQPPGIEGQKKNPDQGNQADDDYAQDGEGPDLKIHGDYRPRYRMTKDGAGLKLLRLCRL